MTYIILSTITNIVLLYLVVVLYMNKNLKINFNILNKRKKHNVFLNFFVNYFNKDFFRWFFPLIGAMSVFFGLLFFLASYRLAEAGVNISNCSNVSVSIVNTSSDSIGLLAADKNINIAPHSSGEYNVLLGHYYTRCGRFDIKTSNGLKKMLVKDGVANVSLRYDSIDNIDTAGISHDDLDSYSQWNSLRDIL